MRAEVSGEGRDICSMSYAQQYMKLLEELVFYCLQLFGA